MRYIEAWNGVGMSVSKVLLGVAEKLRPVLVKVIPQSVLTRVKAGVVTREAKAIEGISLEAYDRKRFPDGVNLIGDIRVDTGLGQSMRYVSDILDNAGVDNLIYNYYVPPGYNMTDHSCDSKIADSLKYNVNIFHINASEMAVGFMDLGRQFWDGHYNIGFWVWEMQEFPEEWLPAFSLVDEIWTPSDFVSDIFRKYTDKPVYTVPFPVSAATDDKYDREYFGLPDDRFLYMMMYDGGSGMPRKNPGAVLESYRKAFGKDRKDVALVVKLKENSDKDIEYIRSIMSGYEVYFIDRNLSRVEVNSLIKCADVYVSLHRSEGFGLTCAEAMVVGTPVIATDWSATTQFMDKSSACMVDCRLVSLDRDMLPFKKGYKWAEADTDCAAGFMKRLVDDREFYDIIKCNALVYVHDKLNMERSVSIVKERLDSIINT